VTQAFDPHFASGASASERSAAKGGQWAGANSNRGYGHPKAEGYQATPPAHSREDGQRRVNLSALSRCGEIDRNDGEHDARTLSEGQRLVEKEDREHRTPDEEHSVDRRDDAHRAARERTVVRENPNGQEHARTDDVEPVRAGELRPERFVPVEDD
jgi:hypothetical protein